MGNPLPCGAGIDGNAIGRTVDVGVGHHVATVTGEVDEALGYVGRHGLALFVEGDIALRPPYAGGQLGLRHLQAIADGFDAVHAASICGANSQCQQRRLFAGAPILAIIA